MSDYFPPWIKGAALYHKAALYFDTFSGGFPSQFVSGYGSGFEATLGLEAVPEPATMCLFGLGALGLLRRKK